jgi:quercetin dioxygenase-like cupin family protein
MTYALSVAIILPIHFFTYENTRLAVYHANKGEGLPKHAHEFSHATMCNGGSCIVRVDDLNGGFKEYIIDKNSQPLNLSAGKWHEIEALEDNSVFVNVFADKYNLQKD